MTSVYRLKIKPHGMDQLEEVRSGFSLDNTQQRFPLNNE